MSITPTSRFNINFDGAITALSDIAVSPPDHDKKVGLSTVKTLPRKRYADGTETIYLPATSIRGRLRNLLTTSVMQILNERNKATFTPEDYLFTASGGIKDRASSNRADDREVDLAGIDALRKSNPIVSLFGAMTMKVAGKVMISDAVPTEPVQPNHLGRSVRAHPLQRSPELSAVLDPAALEQFRKLDAARAQGNILEDEAQQLEFQARRLKQSQTPDPDRIAQLIHSAKEKRAAAEEAREIAGGAVNIQQLLGGYETIPTATSLNHSMRVRDASCEELAFMLMGLQLLAFDPFVGAHRSQGNGKLKLSYVMTISEKRSASVPAGTALVEPFSDLVLSTDHPFVQEAWALSQRLIQGDLLDTFSFADAA